MSEAVRAAKAELRDSLRERRRRLDPSDIQRWSVALCDHVRRSPHWAAARAVAAFVGVKNEPDTLPLLRAARAEGKTLLLPRVRPGGEPTIDFVVVHDLDAELVASSYGLREPAGTTVHHLAELAELALVLVPGLAFARSGDRIGLGPGYYDRALASIATRSIPLRMGVCFSCFLDPAEGSIPMEPTDVPMHAVATELGIALVQKKS